MTSFIASPAVPPEPDLPNHPFFPAISPSDCRAVMSFDGAVTPARLAFALTEAVVKTNEDLKAWRLAQQAAGVATLADLGGDDPGRAVHLYKRAVYERAKADLMERSIGYSATADGERHAAARDPAIDDHYRNALWSIRDLTGQRRTTVELI